MSFCASSDDSEHHPFLGLSIHPCQLVWLCLALQVHFDQAFNTVRVGIKAKAVSGKPKGNGVHRGLEEWEIVEDDGFIYKCQKRKGVAPSPATLADRQKPVLSEEAQLRAREIQTRRMKMATLLAQKEMYVAEIADWEMLLKRQEESLACAPISHSPSSQEQVGVHSTNEATSNAELQFLHLQVEAYERFIQQLQSLRDQGESICKRLEMDVQTNGLHLEQDMLKEATKFTPRTIIHNFTSPGQPLPVGDLPAKVLLGQLLSNDD